MWGTQYARYVKVSSGQSSWAWTALPAPSLYMYLNSFYVTVEPISYNIPTQTAIANATNMISDALGYKQQPALLKNCLKTSELKKRGHFTRNPEVGSSQGGLSVKSLLTSCCSDKLSQTWWLKTAKFILLQFWKPEVWNQFYWIKSPWLDCFLKVLGEKLFPCFL